MSKELKESKLHFNDIGGNTSNVYVIINKKTEEQFETSWKDMVRRHFDDNFKIKLLGKHYEDSDGDDVRELIVGKKTYQRLKDILDKPWRIKDLEGIRPDTKVCCSVYCQSWTTTLAELIKHGYDGTIIDCWVWEGDGYNEVIVMGLEDTYNAIKKTCKGKLNTWK